MINLLVLIIANDATPEYCELQNLWKDQFKAHKEIDFYFLKCDPDLETDFKVNENTFYAKCEETIHHGITYKTALAFKKFINDNLNDKVYDFILRTNLSSIYDFSKLIKYLESSSRNNFWGGVGANHDGINFVSGCGFIVSNDIAHFIGTNYNSVWDPKILHDDVCFGKLISQKVKRSVEIKRYDIVSKIDTIPDLINENYFHVRIKYEPDRSWDIQTRKKILKQFYPNL